MRVVGTHSVRVGRRQRSALDGRKLSPAKPASAAPARWLRWWRECSNGVELAHGTNSGDGAGAKRSRGELWVGDAGADACRRKAFGVRRVAGVTRSEWPEAELREASAGAGMQTASRGGELLRELRGNLPARMGSAARTSARRESPFPRKARIKRSLGGPKKT